MRKLTFTPGPDTDKRFFSEVLTAGADGRIAFQFNPLAEGSYDVGFLASLNGTDFTEIDLRVIRESHMTVMDGLKPGTQVKLRCSVNADAYALV